MYLHTTGTEHDKLKLKLNMVLHLKSYCVSLATRNYSVTLPPDTSEHAQS